MDFSTAGILLLDGVTNGAVYGLLALATVLVFAVTRVIFIPQGEFVAYGALTLAILQTGNAPGTFLQRNGDLPGTLWLMAALAVIAAALDAPTRCGAACPRPPWRATRRARSSRRWSSPR